MERVVFLLVLLCGLSYALPKIRKVEDPVENQYIVVLRVRSMINSVSRKVSGDLTRDLTVLLRDFAVKKNNCR